MRHPTRVAPVVLAGIALLEIASCGGGSGSTPAAPRPAGRLARDAELLRGREIYVEFCSGCHGISGGGNVGPSFTDGKLRRDFPDAEAQEALVRTGRGVMPGFGSTLDDDQIRAVVTLRA
jgi:mono/diheme cytochrome c family protein